MDFFLTRAKSVKEFFSFLGNKNGKSKLEKPEEEITKFRKNVVEKSEKCGNTE